MSYKLDYVGKTFGAWTALKKVQHGSRNSMWLCRCQCGTEKVIRSTELKNGRSKSCGCLKNKYLKEAFTTHGRSRGEDKYLYSIWIDVIRRCYDKRRPAYKYYGERGITVCEKMERIFYRFYG